MVRCGTVMGYVVACRGVACCDVACRGVACGVRLVPSRGWSVGRLEGVGDADGRGVMAGVLVRGWLSFEIGWGKALGSRALPERRKALNPVIPLRSWCCRCCATL